MNSPKNPTYEIYQGENYGLLSSFCNYKYTDIEQHYL